MSDLATLLNTAAAILAVVVMIVRFKFNPVVSLVVGSAYLGLAVGLGSEKTIDAITGGFGEIMAKVGLLIAFGVLMGAMLQQTGAIQRLVETLLRVFGPKRMPYAMSLTIATLLQSIFLDVLLVISAPLGRTLAKKIGKNGTGTMAVAMAIGLECGIVLTVPGVGALALAGLLGVPLGKMLLFGLMLVIPTVTISVAIMSSCSTTAGGTRPATSRTSSATDPNRLDDDGPTRPPVRRRPGTGGLAASPRHDSGGARAQTPLILLFAPMLVFPCSSPPVRSWVAVDIQNPIVTFVSDR